MTRHELRTDPPALSAVAQVWERQVEELHTARRLLAGADPGLLGVRVAPVAAGFLDHWSTTLGAHGVAAEEHAGAVRALWPVLGATDLDAALRLGRLPDSGPWWSR
ncbi:hypothetical protein [Nocardioides sp. GXZ039]|uniref:hypothetical protein n=1 Tax=Nocardioides sp. GXZ039 TaxID=3136018 RepID=UPI0030F3C1BE